MASTTTWFPLGRVGRQRDGLQIGDCVAPSDGAGAFCWTLHAVIDDAPALYIATTVPAYLT